MRATIYLNIGTNSGDRRAFIARAVAALFASPAFAGASWHLSAPVLSEPWGYESDNTFINIGLSATLVRSGAWSADSLHALLDATQAIERSLSAMPHRHSDGSYADREIDIDIIAVDAVRLRTPRLTLPHPRAHLRPFVAGPLADLGGSV